MRNFKYFLLLPTLLSGAIPFQANAQTANSNDTSYGRWDDRAGTARPNSWVPGTSYGYVGGGVGGVDYNLNGCTPGFACDDRDIGFKLFTGGQFNRMFGVEAAYVNLGKAERNGGSVKAQGANLSLVANLPIGDRFGVFGKVGGFYGWTRTSSAIPGAATGTEDGLNWSLGAGAQFELDRNWALRADWDRYRVKYSYGKDDINLYSLSLLYKF